MHAIDLCGEWLLRHKGEQERIKAEVPGCVHTDLLAAGKMDDPYYRDNENRVQWIGETDWVYSRTFYTAPEVLEYDRILLRCEGLDTLAGIKVNGKLIGRTDNMFRTWEFDVKNVLKKGKNTIEVTFRSTIPYINRRNKEQKLNSWGVGPEKMRPRGWIRKEQCNYGWDWGPVLVTCGIWRDIRIMAFNAARLTDIRIQQDHSKRGVVILEVEASAEKTRKSALNIGVTVSLKNKVVAEHGACFKGRSIRLKLMIGNPKLWWPNSMGKQHLYEVSVVLTDSNGILLDAETRRIGLRTLRLQRKKDRWGESFQFVVNSVPFFAKGANWIPADTFASRVTRKQYEYLLESAAKANMNMLRVWGGGIYEDDVFYDICDELGICIWQDFMFSCGTYPSFDKGFMKNVKAEAEDTIRRIRHHPCMALWCGNNELEQGLVAQEWNEYKMSWADYRKLFDKLLPSLVRKLDPDRDYWPASPHSPRGDRTDFNNPQCGDAHLWSVWHGKMPFEWYRTCTHRFNSEFGFQSFPEPKTVRAYTAPDDRNVTSYVMEHHQRSGIGNTTIMTYMLDWFRFPKGFDMTLWLSQILQAMAMKYAVEHWRRSMPRGMGTLYWQINDCWPVASWSSIDSMGRWKALHYVARRFFAPILISGVENNEKGTVEVYLTSDLLRSCKGTVVWTLTDTAGRMLGSGKKRAQALARKSRRVITLDLKQDLQMYGSHALMLWLDFCVKGKTVSSNFVSFARPKHLEIKDPDISAKVKSLRNGRFSVTLMSKAPALWVWLELSRLNAEFSDNFFHLVPGKKIEVMVCTERSVTVSRLKKELKVYSLRDTY